MQHSTSEAKKSAAPQPHAKRSLFNELMSGVEAIRDHREGRSTLRTHEITPIALPPIDLALP